MRMQLRSRLGIFSILSSFIVVVAVIAAITSPHSRASAAADTCHVVLSLDSSGSTAPDWDQFKSQVLSIFPENVDYGGGPGVSLNRSDVDISFVSFAYDPDTNSTNFNKHYSNGYVNAQDNSTILDNVFNDPLNAIDSTEGGWTSYSQAFGYNPYFLPGATGSTQADFGLRGNTNSAVQSIFHPPTSRLPGNKPDLIILLTDGEPNAPGNNNGTPNGFIYNGADGAINSALKAKAQYTNGSSSPNNSSDPSTTKFAAGFINHSGTPANPVPGSLTQIIAREDIDPSHPGTTYNVGPLGTDNTLSTFIKNNIINYCGPANTSTYDLQPVANVNGTAVKAGDTVNFGYSVNNVDPTDPSNPSTVNGSSNWKLYDVVLDPEVTTDPLNFKGTQSACTTTTGQAYCDNVPDCTAIKGMFGNKGQCYDLSTTAMRGVCAGSSATPGSSSSPYNFVPGSNNTTTGFYDPPRCQTIEDLRLGARVCSILAVAQPGGGKSNRISSAACVTVGKTPLVQIQGGDLRVGRQLNTLSLPDLSAGVYTSQFKISGDPAIVPYGRTYGSWGEYGVLAPGPVERFASLSGFAGANGGYDGQVAGDACGDTTQKSAFARLTFANTVADSSHSNKCGYLSESPGLSPDLVPSLTSGSSTSCVATTPVDPNTSAGLYKNEDHNTVIEPTKADCTIKDGTLTKGKTIIVYAPYGTVTVTGDIHYKDDPSDKYNKIADIPQLVIIAKDIAINEGVNNVDAWLVAIGEGTGGGKIATCANFVLPLRSEVCKQPLKINGPVIARQLDLWRTKVDDSDPSCKINAASDCSTSGDPAEVINLPASSVLWARAYKQNDARVQTTYTTELPPRF